MNKDSRTKNSILIMTSGVVQRLINILIGFGSRKIFIVFLGIEYLGINGLFTNILSFLSLAELGIGSAITVYLYKPLAEHDEEKIGMYMRFYKKCYFIIGCVVLVIGLSLIPFLPRLVNFEQSIDINLYTVYLLFLANSVCSYWFFAYKSSLLNADQKGYIINNITTICSTLSSILKCIIIIVFRKFELALATELAVGIGQNILIALKTDHMYPVIKKRCEKQLDNSLVRKMFQDVKGLAIQNIAVNLFAATDNIIISITLGTVYVGLCDNYKMIINYIAVIVAMMTASLSAGIGNLIAKESKERQIRVFMELDFGCFWICSFCSVCLGQLLTPFIQLVFGENLIVSKTIVVLMSIDFYISISRNISSAFKTSMGLLKEGCYLALLGGSLNVILSVLWAKSIGLQGVFWATVVTKFLLLFLPTGWYVFKDGFCCSQWKYIWIQIKRTLLTIFLIMLVKGCCDFWKTNTWLSFIVQGIFCVIIPNVVIVMFFWKKAEFQAVIARIKNLKQVLKMK